MQAVLQFVNQFGVSGDAAVRRAAKAFYSRRLAFYETLASRLEDTAGRKTLLDMFETDAGRYGGTPRGVLSAHWATRYHETGARLAETWEGTLPADEVALIAVAEEQGVEAVVVALRDLSRVGNVIAGARKEFVSTIAASLFGIVMAFGMLMAVAFFFTPFLAKAFSFVPPENYGHLTKRFFALGRAVHATWWLIAGVAIACVAWTTWALPNWTGARRSWCDNSVLIFRLYRDFKGALFLATFASLTKGRSGGATTGQRDALVMIQGRSQPWLAWKIAQMIQRIDDRGALDASTIDVGVVDREIYFMVADICDARGISEGLQIAGRASEKQAAATITARAKLLRYLLLGGSVAVVITLFLWLYAVMFEFKTAAQLVT